MLYKEDNPYIDKVNNHDKILVDKSKIYINNSCWNKFFKNNFNIVLEIWTWMGNFFSNLVSKEYNSNFIWIELKYKRLFFTAEKSLNKGSTNNFCLIKDYWQNIDKIFWINELSKVIIFFPDPWWKKDRQKKHRLFSQDFVNKLYNVLKEWWCILFKTDHREYFDTTLNYFDEDLWKIEKLSYDYEKDLDVFDKKNMTEFEHIFRENRSKINYVEFIKK